MFVCLWSPVWRTVADSLADLSPALLTVAPRVVTEERRGGLVWVDARGLDAEHIARSAVEVLRGLGLSNVRVGIGTTAIIAEVLAGDGKRETGDGTPSGDPSTRDGHPEGFPFPVSRFPSPVSRFPVSALGSLPISVLQPDPALAVLLDGIGVETCGELAELAGESVEVRLGADGVRLWKLARGEDDRLIFSPMPRELPHASLEWSDYVLTDTERLLFSVNALLGTVCEKLVERGSLAREMTLDFKLSRGDTLATAIRAGRATASRKTWLRLARSTLERMVLPAGVVGLALRAAAIVTDDGHQGDLFDRGFATASATEAALASLAEEQGDVVVVPENTAHPLVERRTKWIGAPGDGRVSAAGGRMETGDGGKREAGGGRREKQRTRRPKAVRESASEPNDDGASIPIRPPAADSRQFPVPSLSPVPGSPFPVPYRPPVDSRLILYLLPTPRAVEAQTEERRDHVLPTAYRDGGAWFKVLSAAGPDRVSGERWGEAFAREYFRCIVDDGGMVWLYHDARSDGWFLHGWWD